jgi:aryl sulfotransferase
MTPIMRAPTREFRTFIMDGHRWDKFAARPDDVVVTTFPKCGTTWTQRIVDLLIFQSPAPRPIMDTAPWLDSTIFAPIDEMISVLEGQAHRRSVKSHMPLDALPIYDGVKYIHVARDGRDACISMHNHMRGIRPETFMKAAAQAMNDPRLNPTPPRPIPEDPREWCVGWLEQAESEPTGAYGTDLPFFEFETTYWRERRQPWLLLVHYNDLKADLAGEMRRISDFLEIDTPASLLPELVKAATFETMKADGQELLPKIGEHFDTGHQRFLHKGTNGRWKDVMNDEDLDRYDALVKRKFTPALAGWIAHGREGGDPRQAAD